MFFSSSTIRMAAISTLRQLQCETAAPPDFALQVDAAAVRLHDVTDDGQAEPGRADFAGLRQLRKRLEYALALLGRDTGPRVGDRHHDPAVLGHGIDSVSYTHLTLPTIYSV